MTAPTRAQQVGLYLALTGLVLYAAVRLLWP
jgi:hypothetical protein